VVAEPQPVVAPQPIVPVAPPRAYPKLKQKDARYATESTEGSKDLPSILQNGERWVAEGRIASIDLYMIKHFGWAQADVDKYVHQKQKAVVSYLGDEEREAFKLQCGPTVTQGPAKTVFDTSNMFSKHSGKGFGIYVMSKHGEVYADQHKVGLFHHSSFLAGGDVAAAGELKVSAGTVRHVTNKTGHYKAGSEELWQLLDEFKRCGVGLGSIGVTLVDAPRPYIGGAAKFYVDHKPA